MSSQCKTCGHINSSESQSCVWCNGMLEQPRLSKIDALITKQEQIEIRYNQEISDLKKELLALKQELENSSQTITSEVVQPEKEEEISKFSPNVDDKVKSVRLEVEDKDSDGELLMLKYGPRVNVSDDKEIDLDNKKEVQKSDSNVLETSQLEKEINSLNLEEGNTDSAKELPSKPTDIPEIKKKELKSLNYEGKIKDFAKKLYIGSTNKPEVNRKPLVKEETVVFSNEIKKTIMSVKTESRPVSKPKPPVQPRKPSAFELKLKKIIEPLHDGLDLVSKVYTKYKTEGQLPIFFMTIAGIVAILFGFGYLMQYSLNAAGVYEGIIKVGLGFSAALVSIIIGMRLSKKETGLKEYASALISLGIILNYIMIYYMTELGNFPTLSTSLIGFLLIVANTGIAIGFALKYEAKIIAVLFVVGGAFTPYYLNSSEDGTFYYLYLWFLTLGSCYVSIKIKWKTLQYLAFSISALLIELVTFTQEPSNVYLGYFHLFAYLFFYFTFFEKGKIKQQLDKIDIVILSSNLGFFSWNLFSVIDSNLFLLGSVYLGNALVFVGLLMKFKKDLDKIGRLIFLIIIGLFIGLAIPSFFQQSVMGLFWSIEAVMLIYLGFLYGNDFIRKEGYLLLGFALVKLGWHSVEIIFNWNQNLWHTGFVNFIILGLVIILCWAFGQRFKSQFNQLEENLFKIFGEIIPVWIITIFGIVLYQFIGVWSLCFLIVPIFSMYYWNSKFKSKSSEVLVGIFLIAVLINLIFTGSEIVLNLLNIEYQGAQVIIEVNKSSSLYSAHFFIYILMGVTISLCWIVAPYCFRELSTFQKRIYRIYKETLPLIIVSVFFYVMSSFIGAWCFTLLIVPIFSMYYWNRVFHVKSAQFLVALFLIITLFKLVYHGLMIYNLIGDSGLFMSVDFVNFILIGLTIVSCWILAPSQFRKLSGLEKTLYRIYKEVVPVFIIATFFILMYQFIGAWSFTLLFVPIFSMYYWNRAFNSKSAKSLVSVFLMLTLLKVSYHGIMSFVTLTDVNLFSSFEFIKFILIGLTIITCWILAPSQFRKLSNLEKTLYRIYKEVVPVFISSVFIVSMFTLLGNWGFPLAIVPLFGLVYWSKFYKTSTTVWFGYAHLSLLLIGMIVSMVEQGSVHFSDQLLFAQVSVVFLIASLWGLKSFFKIVGLESSSSFSLANALRVVFFCLIPLLFVQFARKIDVKLIGSAVWISVLIAYFLYQKLKYKALKIELIVLMILAFVYVVALLDSIGSIVGVVVLVAFVLLEKSYEKEHLKKSIFEVLLTLIPYLTLALLWFVVYGFSHENPSVAFSVIAVSALVAVYFKDKLALVEVSYVSMIRFSVVTLVLGFGCCLFNEVGVVPLFAIAYVVLLGILLYNKKAWYNLEKEMNRWNFTFVIHQLFIIMTIVTLLDLFTIDLLGPLSSVLLVVNAIVLVFIALKEGRPFINKVSMFMFGAALLKIISFDISDFSMVQKVIVFLILGVLLLGASYGYVKLKKRFETDDLD